MKKNKAKAMDELKIDKNIRGLVGQLWKHGYKTHFSCEGEVKSKYGRVIDSIRLIPKLFYDKGGHSADAYIVVSGGDGWLEKNASRYGLKKEASKKKVWNHDLKGTATYRGILVSDPLAPKKGDRYVDPESGKVARGAEKAVRSLAKDMSEAEGDKVKVPVNKLEQLLDLEPRNQRQKLRHYIEEHHEGKYVQLPVEDLADYLSALKKAGKHRYSDFSLVVAGVLSVVVAVGINGIPGVTGFVVSSSVTSWNLRLPAVVILMVAVGYICFRAKR